MTELSDMKSPQSQNEIHNYFTRLDAFKNKLLKFIIDLGNSSLTNLNQSFTSFLLEFSTSSLICPDTDPAGDNQHHSCSITDSQIRMIMKIIFSCSARNQSGTVFTEQ